VIVGSGRNGEKRFESERETRVAHRKKKLTGLWAKVIVGERMGNFAEWAAPHTHEKQICTLMGHKPLQF
jgi:hypothetical protein